MIYILMLYLYICKYLWFENIERLKFSVKLYCLVIYINAGVKLNIQSRQSSIWFKSFTFWILIKITKNGKSCYYDDPCLNWISGSNKKHSGHELKTRYVLQVSISMQLRSFLYKRKMYKTLGMIIVKFIFFNFYGCSE